MRLVRLAIVLFLFLPLLGLKCSDDVADPAVQRAGSQLLDDITKRLRGASPEEATRGLDVEVGTANQGLEALRTQTSPVYEAVHRMANSYSDSDASVGIKLSCAANDAYGIANANTLEERHLQALGVGRSTRAQIAAAGNLLIGWYEAWTAEPNEQARKQLELQISMFCILNT
jgi:hypothetical protein